MYASRLTLLKSDCLSEKAIVVLRTYPSYFFTYRTKSIGGLGIGFRSKKNTIYMGILQKNRKK